MSTEASSSAGSPWSWRLAYNHVFLDIDGQATFHAYDMTDHCACDPMWGLARSIADPNEGSLLCPKCMEIVRRRPQGRPQREAKSA